MKSTKSQEQVLTELKSKLKEGDIIFSAIGGPLFRRIASSSGSWTSHVGIIFKGKEGQWLVAESKVPFSCYTSLENFVVRSVGLKIATRRVKKHLTSREIHQLRLAAEKRMGKIYDFSYNLDNTKSQYCSKFVFEVYQEALVIEIGKNEKFEEIYAQSPKLSLSFCRLWYLGRIPWKMKTVTPASQFNDDRLESIYCHMA